MVEIWIAIAAGLFVVALTLLASYRVIQDDLSSGAQRIFQIAIIWCIPFFGALFMLMVKQQQSSEASLRAGKSEGEDGEDDPADDIREAVGIIAHDNKGGNFCDQPQSNCDSQAPSDPS